MTREAYPMRWPDAKDKYWFCGHAIKRPTCPRGSHWTPFCISKGNEPSHGACGEHDQPWAGWVQARNQREARKAVAAIYSESAEKYWKKILNAGP